MDRVFEFVKLTNFASKAIAVAAGIDHSLILADDHKIYSAGNNIEGNLGLGHTYSSDSFLLVHGLNGMKFK